MKLAPLLVQFLLTHKRLDLPGIGTFLISELQYPDPDHHKHEKQTGIDRVQFESNIHAEQSPELIQFIADHSGKIKALASADLESHLELAQQFLNIGNPFLFEGIGTLVKIKPGEYALTTQAGLHDKTKDHLHRDKQEVPVAGEFQNDYKKIFYSGKGTMKWQKPVVIILVIAGLALAVWGGYKVYKMTRGKNKQDQGQENKQEETVPAKDTVMYQKDSVISTTLPPPAGMQKFVLEISNAKRAFERYGRLKTFQWDVHMETKDSVSFKLYLILPATSGDTSRMLDSLSRLNGRRVYIEQ